METYIIKVNGKTYEVEVSKKNEEAAIFGAAGAETQTEAKTQNTTGNNSPASKNTSSGDSGDRAEAGMSVTAGTSGKIWKISTQKGEMLKKGDTILILEAMKMEIPVVAPEDGRLERILVSEGDTVEAGQIVAVMA